MIQINFLIIHELIKEAQKTESSGKFSDKINSVDSSNNKLVESLNQTFNHSSVKHAKFADRNDRIFKKQFENFLEDMTFERFYNFSKDAIIDLCLLVEKEPFATGGYYLFVNYTLEEKEYTSIILLRKKDGFDLKMVENVFRTSEVQSLNIDKIAMGFRFNHSVYAKDGDDRNYIGLVANQNEKLSEYFKQWVVAENVISDDTNTRNLVKIVKTMQTPIRDGVQIDRDDFTKECYDFINSMPDKMVDLIAMGHHFYGEERKMIFIENALELEIIIDTEFKKSASLRNLIKIRATVEGIELTVSYNKLNPNDVDVTENQIIIRNPELAKQILAQRN